MVVTKEFLWGARLVDSKAVKLVRLKVALLVASLAVLKVVQMVVPMVDK